MIQTADIWETAKDNIECEEQIQNGAAWPHFQSETASALVLCLGYLLIHVLQPRFCSWYIYAGTH